MDNLTPKEVRAYTTGIKAREKQLNNLHNQMDDLSYNISLINSEIDEMKYQVRKSGHNY